MYWANHLWLGHSTHGSYMYAPLYSMYMCCFGECLCHLSLAQYNDSFMTSLLRWLHTMIKTHLISSIIRSYVVCCVCSAASEWGHTNAYLVPSNESQLLSLAWYSRLLSDKVASTWAECWQGFVSNRPMSLDILPMCTGLYPCNIVNLEALNEYTLNWHHTSVFFSSAYPFVSDL